MIERNREKGHGLWPRSISRDQARDTGMAMALICLILFGITRAEAWVFAGAALLLTDMVVPRVFTPLGRVWFGLSNLMGLVVSRLLIGLVFYVVVTPVGLIRRRMGKDTLNLTRFKQGEDSVFVSRDHTYQPSDVEQPF